MMKIWYKYIILMVLVFFLLGCQSLAGTEVEDVVVVDEKKEETILLKITAAGDVMAHYAQLKAQYDSESKNYNFENNFEYIKAYISDSDLSICNVETTFAGENEKYSAYPRFNTPDAMALAIKDAGFDIVSSVNNHCMDKGSKGFLRTIEVLRKTGLDVVGAKKEIEEKDYIIKAVKGIPVGITAYTYETPEYNGRKTINSIIVPDEIEDLINTFNYKSLDADLEKMKNVIEEMKSDGAEIIVFYIHWGDEYHLVENENQQKIAKFLCNQGVDVVFGSHPHVIQPMEVIRNDEDDKEMLVVYSMGNFISNQRYEMLGKRHTEDGLVVNVYFEKDEDGICLKKVSFIPTWVHKYFENGKFNYSIVPLIQALWNPEKYRLSSTEMLWRAKNSYNNTLDIIEKKYLENDEMTFVFWE